MKIIIPMAGKSQRFIDKGYSTPKPFIFIDGQPMIHRVSSMFETTDELHLVCDAAHLRVPAYRAILDAIPQRHVIYETERHPAGPTGTLLHLKDKIPAHEPVLVSYCDFYVEWNAARFKERISGYDGAIPCFRGIQPASFGRTFYAYTRVNERSELLELREKKSFTDHRENELASAGLYYFQSWGLLMRHAEELLRQRKPGDLELYASLPYNGMVREGKRVLVTEVDKFICWGTPEDLEQYLQWSAYFNRHASAMAEGAS